ncbi:protein ANTAGONIST OF LIKE HETEROCHROMATIN PROTEIN 1-like [Ixodes scapularis]
MKRMRDGDVDFFVRFYRMTPPTFGELHDMVKEDLTRQFFIREPLPSEERLAIALSYLSSGQQIKDVALLYRVGLETARQAVHVTCRALWERLHQPFMKPPTEAEWVEIAEGFRRRRQFPNCLGAVDGKHVAITCPKDSGSVFYNYKVCIR